MFQDLRQGVRALRRNPGFATAAILTLALGIGGVAAVFSLVEAVLMRPLPVRDPERLAMIWETNVGRGRDRNVVGPYNFLRWRERNRSFEDMTMFITFDTNVAGDFEPERVPSALVSSSFFAVFGAAPRLGRGFTAEDGVENSPKVVMLGEGYWRRRFGGDASTIGRTLEVAGDRSEIVGIARDDLPFVAGSDVFRPIQVTDRMRNGRGRSLRVVSRLKPGVIMAKDGADNWALGAGLETENPDFNKGWGVNVFPLHTDLVRETRPALLALLGVVALVLAVAAANVSNLLLSRALAREKEVALRAALGAGAGRLFRQLLVESSVLGVCGAACGIALGWASLRFLVLLLPPELVLAAPIGMNTASVVATSAVAILAAVAAGLVPALGLVRPSLISALKDGRSVQGASRGRIRTRSVLVVAEMALSIVALTAAGLLLRSFWQLTNTSPGYDAARAFTSEVNLTVDEGEKQSAFFDSLVTKLNGSPAVEAAGAISWAPLGAGSATRFSVLDREKPPQGQEPVGDIRIITPDLFRAHGIPLLRGRDFTRSDRIGAPDVVIVNQALADTFWPGQDPIGRRIGMEWGREIEAQVVGVVGDVRLKSIDTPARATLYWPQLQVPNSFMTVIVRSERSPGDVAALLKSSVAELDPRLPAGPIESLDDRVAASLTSRRVLLVLIGAFSVLALSLAAVGLYGVLSYTVAQRSPELGVRMALGADGGNVARMVIGDGLKLVGLGVLAGLGGSVLAGRLLTGLLFGVEPWDPIALVSVVSLTVVVAVVTLVVPARRAALTDPMVALRYE